MDSAKKLARDMLEAINVDGSGFIGAFSKGIISLPVSLGYLGYDFIDSEHRRENQSDKFRLAELVKTIKFNREVIEKVISVFMEDFASRVNITAMEKTMAGNTLGKAFFAQLTGVKLGSVLSARTTSTILAGTAIGIFVSIGAESSRAIYTSRYLRERNPSIYNKLKQMGDLDLLYFFVEDTVKPFEKACQIADVNPSDFNDICEYFFGGL